MAHLQRKPTTKQEKWIRENYLNVRNIDIATKYKINKEKVAVWLKLLGLSKGKRVYLRKENTKRKKKKHVNEPIKWLSREYSNVTRDQHIDRILSIKI